MALFDSLLGEVKQRLGLGEEQGGRLLNALLSLITDEAQGGLSGFLSRFQNAGLGDYAQSWLGQGANTALSATQVEQALGGATVERLAAQAGISKSTAASALAFMIPSVVDRLTPAGVIPSVQSLLGTLSGYVGAAAGRVAGAARDVAAGVSTAGGATRVTVHETPRRSGLGAWWPLLLLLALALAGWWWLRSRPAAPVEPTTTEAPAPAAPAPSATLPASLTIRNVGGKVTVSGSVPDAASRDQILAALRAAFGEANVSGDLTVDAAVQRPSWLARIKDFVAALKTPGTEVSFDGDRLSVGGSLTDAQRTALLDKLKAIFGTELTIGTFADRASAMTRSALDQAAAALAGLKPGYGANDLVSALNISIINFASGSAEIPAESRDLLTKAAAAMKQAPSGTVIEIAGHTDSTGDAAANEKLSQARAQAVRVALIDLGVNPDMLQAKGYGGSRPVASNDTEAGRFRNRRIEYAAVKS